MEKYREQIKNVKTGEIELVERDFTTEELDMLQNHEKYNEIARIKLELSQLDLKVSREMEDLISDNDLTVNDYQKITLARKKELRRELRGLSD